MKKNIIYGVVFLFLLLAGGFSFYIYYQESYFSINLDLVNITVDSEYWISGDVNVTVEYQNTDIPIQEYSFDGGETWQEGNTYTVTENKVLEIVLKTQNGRTSKPIPYRIENIDKDKPQIVSENIIYIAQGSEFHLKDNYSVIDLGSGIKGKVNLSLTEIDTSKIDTIEVEISAMDRALNSNTKTMVISILDPSDPLLKKEPEDLVIPVTGLTLSPTRISLVKDTTATIEASVKPSNATNQKILWESHNESIATVDENGTITAIKQGSTTITATTEDGNKKSDVRVTVTNNQVLVDKIELDRETDTVTTDSENIILTATIKPETATDTRITWNSSNPNVAVVVNGVVTIRGEGTTNITATTSNGKVATYVLNVVDHYTFQEKELRLETGEIMGYTLKIYKNGIDITKDISAIMSPFLLKNDKKKEEIELTELYHSQLGEQISFTYKAKRYTAVK